MYSNSVSELDILDLYREMASVLANKWPQVARYVVPVACAGAAYYLIRGKISAKNESNTLFGSGDWVTLQLASIRDETHDTKRFVFKFPEADQVAGMPLASAVFVRYRDAKDLTHTVRPYTPVSDLDERGQLELAIKKYTNGPMSTHIHNLKVGDTLEFKGPIKKFQWTNNEFDQITLVGAGSGITPLYQLARHILNRGEDKTKITLLYGNKSPADIILKSELDDLRMKFSDRFEVVYYVDSNESTNTVSKLEHGFITKAQIQKYAAPPLGNTHVFVCGPPAFMKAISGEKKTKTEQGEVQGILKELGYTEKQVFKY